MLIYLSGLKNIPTDLYEAAIMDGASAWQKFRNITLPLLTPSFTVCVTLSLTAWFREFGMTLSATGGGPAGSTRTLSIYILRIFTVIARRDTGRQLHLCLQYSWQL